MRHEYDESELAAIVERAEAGDLVGVLVAAFVPFGVDLRDADGPSISPMDYAVPAEQWRSICGALTHAARPAGAIGAVNLALDWMNLGPSSYEPESVESG